MIPEASGNVNGPLKTRAETFSRSANTVYSTTNTVYGATNTDAGVGIGLLRGGKQLTNENNGL